MDVTGPSEGDALLSISIDVAGSTSAKQSIQAFQSKYGSYEGQFEGYLASFSAIEHQFYQALQKAPVARLADLFVVKHIGDEIWCVVVLKASQSSRSKALIHDVLSALRTMMSRTGVMTFTITNTPKDPCEEKWEDVEFEQIDLGVKVTVDLLRHVVDFTKFRTECLGKHFMRRTTDEKEVEDIADVLQRLNLGTTRANGTKVQIATRSDYVGLEVDRFFRLTKYAKPGLILMGNALADFLELQDADVPSSFAPVALAPRARGVRDRVVDAKASVPAACTGATDDEPKGRGCRISSYWRASNDRAFYETHPDAEPQATHAEQLQIIPCDPMKLKGITAPYSFRYIFSRFGGALPGGALLIDYDGLYKDTVDFLRQQNALPPPPEMPEETTGVEPPSS
jgi:hypothetical protein